VLNPQIEALLAVARRAIVFWAPVQCSQHASTEGCVGEVNHG
jgi:hypothetical protein